MTVRVPLPRIEPGEVALDGNAAKYVARVRRLGPGDAFVAFDPERALEADASVLDARPGRVRVRLGEARPASVRATRAVTLVQAIGKGDKLDAVVRDATELGATRIVPAIASRSIPRIAEAAARTARWRRIAVEAARQCGRGDAPAVEAPVNLAEAVRRIASEPAPPEGRSALCLDPSGDEPLGPRLRALSAREEVAIVVGPEGGLDETELAVARDAGFARVSLGPFVLRTETVCAAVLGALLVVPSRP